MPHPLTVSWLLLFLIGVSAFRGPFEDLGIKKGADITAIKKAYRKNALKYHPDKNVGNEEAAERFRKIQEAYEELMSMKEKGTSCEHTPYVFIILYYDHPLFKRAAITEQARVTRYWKAVLESKEKDVDEFCVAKFHFSSKDHFFRVWNEDLHVYDSHIVGVSIFSDAFKDPEDHVHIGVQFAFNRDHNSKHEMITYRDMNKLRQRLFVPHLMHKFGKNVRAQLRLYGCDIGQFAGTFRRFAFDDEQQVEVSGERGIAYFSMKRDQYEKVTDDHDGAVYLRTYFVGKNFFIRPSMKGKVKDPWYTDEGWGI